MVSSPQFSSPENESSILRFQLDVRETVEEIRFLLNNLEYDPIGDKIVKKGEPLYPSDAIDKIMRIVKSFINKDLILSGFTDKDIYNLCRNTLFDLIDFQTYNANYLKVVDKNEINLIFDVIFNYVFSTLKRALNYKTLTHTDRAKIVEINNPNQQQFDPTMNNQMMKRGRF